MSKSICFSLLAAGLLLCVGCASGNQASQPNFGSQSFDAPQGSSSSFSQPGGVPSQPASFGGGSGSTNFSQGSGSS